MTAIIADSCNYTRQGLVTFLSSRGWVKHEIYGVDNVNDLTGGLADCQPSVVFINEDCFIHNQKQCEKIRSIIIQNPGVLFVVFITQNNIRLHNYLRIKDNLLVCSKIMKIAQLDDIYRIFLRVKRIRLNAISLPVLSLNRVQSRVLKSWMAGQNITQIATQMDVAPKRVYTLKYSIRTKFEAHSTQVVYHIYRLTEHIAYGVLTE